MLTIDRLSQWEGAPVIGAEGDKIGTMIDVYYDDATGEPEWIAVNRGLFGLKTSLVPLTGARPEDNTLRVPYTKEQVKAAPDVDPDGDISPEEEDRLLAYYGAASRPSGREAGGSEMVRSEEVADIGTVRRPRELVKLKKRVKTEHVTKTVPVEREEIVVEREPISGGTRGADIRDDEVAAEAFEEEPVVRTRTEPRERVSLSKDTQREDRQVGAEVRKEEIDVDRSKRR